MIVRYEVFDCLSYFLYAGSGYALSFFEVFQLLNFIHVRVMICDPKIFVDGIEKR